jgi:hypothetical protein
MNERGIALPAALLALSLLTALMIAFALLGSSEPVIAGNHVLSARARAFAESGLERAMWALSHPASTDGIADPMASSPAPAPYDGATASFRAVEVVGGVNQGGFVVTVANAASGRVNERDITAVGYVPDAAGPRAIRRIVATVMKLKWLDPPCALCLGGETPDNGTSTLQVGGNASVNGSNTVGSPPGAYCSGVTPRAAILTTGVVDTNGNPELIAPTNGADIIQHEPRSTFEPFKLTDEDMAVLKAMAKANGTYYQGAQSFTSPPPSGIVFVDTPSGNPLTPSSPSSDLFTVDVHGNWSTGWRGWFIVAGSLQVSGQVDMTGLIYVQNDISYHGQGNSRIRGAIVVSNRVDTVSSQIDSEDIGNGRLVYDCPAVRDGGGALSQNWFVKPGSYREVAEQ